jgi:hypothetical protein
MLLLFQLTLVAGPFVGLVMLIANLSSQSSGWFALNELLWIAAYGAFRYVRRQHILNIRQLGARKHQISLIQQLQHHLSTSSEGGLKWRDVPVHLRKSTIGSAVWVFIAILGAICSIILQVETTDIFTLVNVILWGAPLMISFTGTKFIG